MGLNPHKAFMLCVRLDGDKSTFTTCSTCRDRGQHVVIAGAGVTYSILGSRKMQGSGSWMQDSNKPANKGQHSAAAAAIGGRGLWVVLLQKI
jgi:hypothetical protein